ncbi:MAG TPA: hypothetical protein VF926_14955 [Mycobacterium sp.]
MSTPVAIKLDLPILQLAVVAERMTSNTKQALQLDNTPAGDSPAKARRALKRRIARAVYHRLLIDRRQSHRAAGDVQVQPA